MSAEISQTELDQIAEKFSSAIRKGQTKSVDEFLEEYPDAPTELKELLDSVALIEGLKQDSSPTGNAASSPSIDQLDDYQILREIGRGGMGIVFDAIHQSLGRRVALKVLSSSLLDDEKHLARFRREARAAARLRHTNIVPVFGVGQAGEHHYYVMDLIDGMSLKDWLGILTGKHRRELPTIDTEVARAESGFSQVDVLGQLPIANEVDKRLEVGAQVTKADSTDYFRWVARVVATVADGLHYAHKQGVLHRDIKPGNLLIDKQNDVWIADFGLAKLSEQQGVTMTGDVVGTPQYMPPESFDGKYDVQSEVYATGLTLYELLALRPAIEGKNTSDTIRKSIEGVKVSPRKFNAKIPRDLETIAMKSLSHTSKSRYRDAEALRDDLNRFLQHRPIAARRAGLIRRVIRWSQREPVVAMLTFATFGLLLALAIVSGIGYARTKHALDETEIARVALNEALSSKTDALDRAEQQRELADEQRERAEGNLQVAVSAFDEITRSIASRGIETDADVLGEVTDTTVASVTPEDAELLQSLLDFFDKLADSNSEDLLAQSALASQRAGDIYMGLGQLKKADRAYTEASLRYDKFVTQQPDATDSVIARAKVMNQLAVIASLRGDVLRANGIFSPTIELIESSPSIMESAEGRFEYARANRLFASISTRIGVDQNNLKFRPGDRRLRSSLGAVALRNRQGRERDAILEAAKTMESLIEEFPTDSRYKAELARVFRSKAIVASNMGRKVEAEGAIRDSINELEDLLKQNPDSQALKYELASTLLSSEAFGYQDRFRVDRAIELIEELLSDSPRLPRYGALKAQSLSRLADLERRSGQLDKAADHLFEAIRVYNALAAASPELELYESLRIQTLESIADVRIDQGNTAAAIDVLERALRQLSPRMRRPDINSLSTVNRMHMGRIQRKLDRLRGNPSREGRGPTRGREP
ncbi:MAG: protein kinase [Planctomycetota bacterium]